MTKKLFLKLASLCILIFVASCRQESILQENANQKFGKNYKVYTLNKNQITSDFTLFGSVAKVQETFSKRNINSKSVQDSILDGGIIGINKVLVVEDDNGKKIYTFPLKRTFISNKIENLVLTKNTDSTFSGYLVQYNISEQEKELFNNWHSIDLNSKIKITNIKKLHINTSANAKPKSETTDDGCITVNYDDGKCNSGQHSYGQVCNLKDPSKHPTQPHVLSIVYNDCFGGGGGGSSSGNGNGGTGGTGGGDGGNSNTGGGADTMPFSDANFNYYNSSDIADPAFQFYSQVSQFIQTQPKNVRDLNMLNPYIFYFTHNYFSIHGMDNTTKSFVAQRLQLIANWFYNINFNNSTFPNPSQKELFATWAFNYMLNHKPDAYNYFVNNIADLDLLFMYITDSNSTNFANSTADTILDILLQNYQNGIFNNDNKQKFFHGLSEYYTDNNGSLDAQNFVTWSLKFKKENPETSWSEFRNWFINGYSDNFKTRITQLSNSELQEYILINQTLATSPYEEEHIKETNEAFVAFSAYTDIENITEAQMQTVLNQCCPSIILFPQYLVQEKTKMIVANYQFYRKFYPQWSKSKCFWEASRETIQLMLDLGGLVPVIGEVCDLTNGVIYTIQGDGVNASLSYASAIPVAGWFASGTKFGVKVVNASDIASRQMLKWIVGTNGVIFFGTNTVTQGRAQLRKVLKLTDATKHDHHLIPVEFAQYVIVQKAAKSSSTFHINEVLNGIPLATSAHLTGHSTYSAKIKEILNNLNQNNLNMSSNEAYNHIVALTSQIKNHINNHPNYNLGQIANLIIYP
jgi:uncharacterized membrane protein YgcG